MGDEPSPLTQAKVEGAIQDVVAMGNVLSKPRWARIWYSVEIQSGNEFLGDGVTAQEIIDETSIPQTTVYEDLKELVKIEALEKESKDRTDRYSTRSGHLMVKTMMVDDSQYLNPVTIGIVGQAYHNEDVELFIERNGYNVLHECCLLSIDEDYDLKDLLYELDAVDANLIEDTVMSVRNELAEKTDWGV